VLAGRRSQPAKDLMTPLTPHSRSLKLDPERKTLAIRDGSVCLEIPRAEVAQMISFLLVHPEFFDDQPTQMPVHRYMLVDTAAFIRCTCKDCPAQCQCPCHTLANQTHDSKYRTHLKEHAGFFAVGALWSIVIVFFWTGLGAAGDLFLAACLLAFFWLCDLVRFFAGKWDHNPLALKMRAKKKGPAVAGQAQGKSGIGGSPPPTWRGW
jgi:hypothetical protein